MNRQGGSNDPEATRFQPAPMRISSAAGHAGHLFHSMPLTMTIIRPARTSVLTSRRVDVPSMGHEPQLNPAWIPANFLIYKGLGPGSEPNGNQSGVDYCPLQRQTDPSVRPVFISL
jgi:hypothetical protein